MEGTPDMDRTELVLHVARHLKRRFYRDVRAQAEGFHTPDRPTAANLPPVLPDVTMLSRGTTFNVIAVETPHTLAHPSTREKWSALARYAEHRKGRFAVVVPRGMRPAAVDRLHSLELRSEVWEI